MWIRRLGEERLLSHGPLGLGVTVIGTSEVGWPG